MGVGLTRDLVSAFPLGSALPGEAGYGEIEAVPEEMDRACLAVEASRELPENMVYPRKYPAVAFHVLLVVGGVLGVFLEVPLLVFQVEGARIAQVNFYAKGFEDGY